MDEIREHGLGITSFLGDSLQAGSDDVAFLLILVMKPVLPLQLPHQFSGLDADTVVHFLNNPLQFLWICKEKGHTLNQF